MSIEKFISSIKETDFCSATEALCEDANAFGFFRKVLDYVEQMKSECPKEAELYACSFLCYLEEIRFPDGRDEKCCETARRLMRSGTPAQHYQITDKWIHPTILQQAAQVPFKFVLDAGLVSEHAGFIIDDWWRMPLI